VCVWKSYIAQQFGEFVLESLFPDISGSSGRTYKTGSEIISLL